MRLPGWLQFRREPAAHRSLVAARVTRLAPLLHALLIAALLFVVTGCGKSDAVKAPATAPTTEPVVAPAPRPATTMAAAGTCITPACHATLAKQNQVHGPVSKGSCDVCHADDSLGNHKFSLKRDGNALCTFCHAISGQRQHQHKVVADKGCLACHDPHASKSKFLVKADSIQFLCTKCHDKPLKKYAHEPFVAGECTTCHDPHESDAKALLRGGNGPAQCFTCHSKMKDAMAKAGHTHPPARRDCLTCHDAHTSDNPRELKKPAVDTCLACHKRVDREMQAATVKHSATTDGRGCANCHDAHASNEANFLVDKTAKVCDSCHAKPITMPDGRVIAAVAPESLGTNVHGPLREGKCTPCHLPHGSTNRALLAKPFPQSAYAPFDEKEYDLCFMCHDKQLVMQEQTNSLTGFRDGTRNLHYVHVHRSPKGRTCKTCHEVHGSDQPYHMASKVQFEGSDWAMPMNYERSPEGGSCSPGCHAKFTYDRGKAATTRPTDGGLR